MDFFFQLYNQRKKQQDIWGVNRTSHILSLGKVISACYLQRLFLFPHSLQLHVKNAVLFAKRLACISFLVCVFGGERKKRRKREIIKAE